jgi:thiol-disulfide isomerase/thioredoxin
VRWIDLLDLFISTFSFFVGWKLSVQNRYKLIHILSLLIVNSLVQFTIPRFYAGNQVKTELNVELEIDALATSVSNMDMPLRNKIILIDFWFTACGNCYKGMPALDELSRSFTDTNLVVLALNTGDDDFDTYQVGAARIAAKGYDFSVAYDQGRYFKAFPELANYPSQAIFDPNGRLRYYSTGYYPDSERLRIRRLRAVLTDLLEEYSR